MPAVSTQTGSPSSTIITSQSSSTGNDNSTPHTTISPPKILRKTEPLYPAEARRKNQQGTVILKVELDESGKIYSIDVFASSGFDLLDQAAVKAVHQWSFSPAKNSTTGVPMSCITHIPIIFNII
jgi:protein TonB